MPISRQISDFTRFLYYPYFSLLRAKQAFLGRIIP